MSQPTNPEVRDCTGCYQPYHCMNDGTIVVPVCGCGPLCEECFENHCVLGCPESEPRKLHGDDRDA